MAKKAIKSMTMIPKKKKEIKKSRSEVYIINKKYYGEEPVFAALVPLNNIEFSRALNWYNYMEDTSDAKEYALEYFEEIKRPDLIQIIKKIPDTWMINSIGWVCRLLSRGYNLPNESREKMIEKTLSLKKYIEKEKVTVENSVSVVERTNNKAALALGSLEDELDNYLFKNETGFSFYNWALKNEYSRPIIVSLREEIEKYLQYYKDIQGNKDVQLMEGYKHRSRVWKKDTVQFFQTMLDDADRLINNANKQRKPRVSKVKIVSTEKILKNFKFLNESGEFKIKSIPPSKIIGSSEVWLFNTKSKHLTVLRSLENGLNIEGTTIKNVDDKNSFFKVVGRKPEEALKGVLAGNKASIKRYFESIKTSANVPTTRTADTTLILRVF